MTQRISANPSRQLRALFDSGAVAGLSDAQLLERFVRARDEASELAFAALVARHGPMVLGVCRRALADPEDADDAFQATFLVLVRKATSVRVDDSLGRWLYGVSRKVAARARIVAARRPRATSRAVEAVASASTDPDRFELRAILDEELGRLPASFRSAIVLCDLEGLSHEEAARDLLCPVGTIKSRLTRGRLKLRERMERRGVSAANSIPPIPIVPGPLAEATARASLAALASPSTAAAAASATPALLAREVLRGLGGSSLRRSIATAWLASAVVGAGVGISTGLIDPAPSRPLGAVVSGPAAVALKDAPARRPADDVVREIDALLKESRRSLSPEEWDRIHGQIAADAQELWLEHPDDPRHARYLAERWSSLNLVRRGAEAEAEIAQVLRTTDDPTLRADALFMDAIYRTLRPIDGPAALSLADEFARQVPHDPRAGELLYKAATELDQGRFLALGVGATLALACGLVSTSMVGRKWWGRAARVVVAGLAVIAVGLVGLRLAGEDSITRLLIDWQARLNDPDARREAVERLGWIAAEFARRWPVLVGTARSALAVVLAMGVGGSLVVRRKFRAGTAPGWASLLRLGVLGFLTSLGVACALEAGLDAWLGRSARARIDRDYPTSHQGRVLRGEDRQRDQRGRPFDLDFTDAISGRPFSIRAMKGKIVVVDFWATWCGPCTFDIIELTRLYHRYHDQGVEFIGVSLDLPEEDGGLESLKQFVAEREIPWPQAYLGHDSRRARKGEATNNFAESWGITAIPVVFLVDADGNLASTEARGRLDDLIPELLRRRDSPGSGR